MIDLREVKGFQNITKQMIKKWTPIPADENKITELEELLQVNHVQARLFLRQGIYSKLEADRFLNPSLDQLHDPFRMDGMIRALERIQQAIDQEEKILIYGDYDVDGVTSVVLLFSFFQHFSNKLDYYIPDRYKEGYGVSMQGIDYASQNGISLIISVDCGIKAVEQVAEAKSRNIDFIICDHHLPEEKLPDAIAILDPKKPACSYPYKELSGCGIAFKLAQAYGTANGWVLEEFKPLLDLVVVSIACDIVPMTGENRMLAHFGLQQINTRPRMGLAALIELSSKKEKLKIEDIVFGIGPMINAAGRIGDAKQAVRLLLSEDSAVTADYARLLKQRNQLRKEFDKSIVAEAIAIHENTAGWEEQKSIVLFHPEWHKGVIGIAASRIVDRYYRPAIILTESNGKAVGSARSIPGFDIYETIKSCSHLLENFGGHQHAAGLTLAIENVPQFKNAFEEAVQARHSSPAKEPEIKYFAELSLNELTADFWKALQAFAPFGPLNRNPVFASRNVVDAGYSQLLKEKHLRLHIYQKDSFSVKAIAFNQEVHFSKIKSQAFDICYTIQENHWRDKVTLQLNVKDIKFENF
ncbi:MAG: single-stranded-DNA-specific exonuclease [Saprospiraceae bacterium]|jgi:single-stranded-DNA-specific exonuclease